MNNHPAFELFKTLKEKFKWMPVLGSIAHLGVGLIAVLYPTSSYGFRTIPTYLFRLELGIFLGTLFLILCTLPNRQSIIAFALLVSTIVFILLVAL